MAVATSEDVETALGRPISSQAQREQVDWWLDGIELLIAHRLGAVAGLDQDVLRYVEVEAVVGKVNRAGRDESSVTVSVDDGSVTRRYENSVASDDITAEWWAMLNPSLTTAMSSIRPGFEADDVRWPIQTPPSCEVWSDPNWQSFP